MKTLKLALVLLGSSLAVAQEFPRYEVSSSYSYGRVDNVNVASPLYSQGWVGSFATNLKRWIAVETEAGGQYNNLVANIQGSSYSLNSGFYSFLGGPRLAYRKGRVVPFAHGLFGVSRALAYGKATYDPTRTTVFVPYDNGFGGAVGGGIDYSISRRMALRTQTDYFFTQPGGIVGFGSQNNFRMLAGIVFSFGSAPALSAKASRPTFTAPPSMAMAARAEVTSTEASQSSSPVVATPSTTTAAPAPTVAASKSEVKVSEAPASSMTITAATPTVASATQAKVVTPAPASQPAVTATRTSPRITPPAPMTAAAQPTSVATAAPAPRPAVTPQAAASVRPNPAPVSPAPAYAAPARQPEPESLGEIARRYREQKERQQQPH